MEVAQVAAEDASRGALMKQLDELKTAAQQSDEKAREQFELVAASDAARDVFIADLKASLTQMEERLRVEVAQVAAEDASCDALMKQLDELKIAAQQSDEKAREQFELLAASDAARDVLNTTLYGFAYLPCQEQMSWDAL